MKLQRKSLRSFHWSEIENYTEREIREGKAKGERISQMSSELIPIFYP